ncbi:MAG TPA: hypothetical protein PKB15_02300 [Acidimicrobiia bacterium]|nr:hypothetical protein [Acidimicrobiia bacterium]
MVAKSPRNVPEKAVILEFGSHDNKHGRVKMVITRSGAIGIEHESVRGELPENALYACVQRLTREYETIYVATSQNLQEFDAPELCTAIRHFETELIAEIEIAWHQDLITQDQRNIAELLIGTISGCQLPSDLDVTRVGSIRKIALGSDHPSLEHAITGSQSSSHPLITLTDSPPNSSGSQLR